MKSKKGLFICFIGIDGSGKTTQAKALAKAMEEDGLRSEYLWGGFEPTIAKPFIAIARRLFLRGKNMFLDYEAHLDTVKALSKNRFLSDIYHLMTLIDCFFNSLWKIRIPLMRGKAVICDRYIYDIVADHAVDSDYSSQQIRKALKFYLRFFPTPDILFLMDLPEDIAYQRKDDIPSLHFLSERRKAYLSIANGNEVTALDGSTDQVTLTNAIRNRVITYMTEQGDPRHCFKRKKSAASDHQ